MTRQEQEAIEKLRGILAEATESENSVCYVTEEDREPLEMAIKALEQEPCEDAISRQDALGAVFGPTKIADIYQEIRDLPPVTPKQRWTPISERLPKKDGEYLVTVKVAHFTIRKCLSFARKLSSRGNEFIGKHYSGWYCYDSEGYYEYKDVIAWMELPEPFEPQESEEENDIG